MKKVRYTYPYVSKHIDVTSKKYIIRMSFSMLLMLVSIVSFGSATYAWFTDAQTSVAAPIRTANYAAQVGSQTGEVHLNDEGTMLVYDCPLTQGDLHTFTIEGTGTAQTGYVIITVGDTVCRTRQLPAGENMGITVQAAQGSVISFQASWGMYESEPSTIALDDTEMADIFYGDGDIITVSRTPYQLYTVGKLVTLEQLAGYYAVSGEDILVYNGITELIEGTEILIPNTSVMEPYVLPFELYTIEEGVTLEQLAKYYGVSAGDILAFNDIKELVDGTEIKIPNTTVTEPFSLPKKAPAETSESTESDTTESGASEPTESDTTETEESESTESDTTETEESESTESETTETEESEPTESDTTETEESEPTESDTTETEESEPTESDTIETGVSESTESETTEPGTSETTEPGTSETTEPEAGGHV